MRNGNRREGKRISVISIYKEGNLWTRLSFGLFGLSNIVEGQIVKGSLFLLLEAAYFLYMIFGGVPCLKKMVTLGTEQQAMIFNEGLGIYERIEGDNSMIILLCGVVTIVISLLFLVLWNVSVRSGEKARQMHLQNKKVPGFKEEMKALLNEEIYKLFLAVPILGIVIFTVIPLVYMFFMAFTNYDAEHQPPGKLFTWVGFENFKLLLYNTDKLSSTFWPVLGWTIIWGAAATFTCYFGGMFLAMLIDSKGIHGKKVWRTIFVTAMAIPSFVSLMVVATMLGSNGIINVLLQKWGFTTTALPFLTNAAWARVTVIVVNMWIGVPVTMVIISGILTNIPDELYESARIDGAGPVMTFATITFPYLLTATIPYLITNAAANFNNFGVIYFLTGGGPETLDYYKGAGKTELLITWLYKLTRDNKDYNLAAAIGIIIFLISSGVLLFVYTRRGVWNKEEEFQ